MTYHELLERFKNDQLDKEQKKQVEADIEKHEAISDYLLEAADIPELEELSLTEPDDSATLTKEAEQSEQFAREIKAYITRAFTKAGIIVGACVLAIVLFVIFGLPKVTDWFYYNPSKVVYTNEDGTEINQVSRDMAVYSELFLPGAYRDSVECESDGYGSYDIYLFDPINPSTYNHSENTFAGKIVRNKMRLYEPDALSRALPGGNFLNDYYDHYDKLNLNRTEFRQSELTEARQQFIESLSHRLEHSDDNEYLVIARLRQVTPYPAVTDWNYDYYSATYNWYPLCWKDETGQYNTVNHIGFLSTGLGSWSPDAETLQALRKEKYPCLEASFGHVSESYDIVRQKMHVSSMLRYVNDHKQFSLMAEAHQKLDEYDLPKDFYSQVAQQIEDHGLYVYTFVSWTDSSGVLTLAGNTDIADIQVYTKTYTDDSSRIAEYNAGGRYIDLTEGYTDENGNWHEWSEGTEYYDAPEEWYMYFDYDDNEWEYEGLHWRYDGYTYDN